MLTDIKVTSALDYASGTADRTGAVLDMTGYKGVLMIVKLAAIATGGVNSVKGQQATAAAFGTPHDLAGSKIDLADDDDNQTVIIDARPTERYACLYVDKDATNACAESAIYLQYAPGRKPQTNDVADAVTTKQAYTGTGTA